MNETDLHTICDERVFDKKYMIKLSLNRGVREAIVNATSWIEDQSLPLKMRCVAIHQRLTADTFPRCIVCGTQSTYDKLYQTHFLDVCGAFCSRKAKRRLEEDTYQRLSDYDWLFDQRINKERSFEDIAVLLQCSPQPVREACKALKIPHVRHNESNSLVLSRLRNKEWLHQKHVSERIKLRDIAKEIGTSAATVQRWLGFHGIIANPQNSYDRKFNKTSKEETEVLDFIQTLLPHEFIKRSDRLILNGPELDILIPSRNLAIEYNGIYSHIYRPEESKIALRKDANYHLGKTLGCQAKGIRLIHIFSDDWTHRKDICKSILRAVLNEVEDIFYARKLSIKEVGLPEKNLFLRENHLQGNDKSCLAFGLYQDNELIALMSFAKSRYNRNFVWELSRFCVRKNSKCIGGFSRLLSHFERNFDGSIISYADFSRSNGDVYKKNGFHFLRRNKPSYAYVNLNKNDIQRRHRSNFRKKRIGAPDNMTEYDFMESLGYRKIFDCGTLVFIKERTQPKD